MNASTITLTAPRLGCTPPASDHELRFDPLFVGGRGLAFPCDAKGRVDLDALSERARHNYFYARTLMGREFAFPVVHETGRHGHAHPRMPAATAPLARLASSALSATRGLLVTAARR